MGFILLLGWFRHGFYDVGFINVTTMLLIGFGNETLDSLFSFTMLLMAWIFDMVFDFIDTYVLECIYLFFNRGTIVLDWCIIIIITFLLSLQYASYYSLMTNIHNYDLMQHRATGFYLLFNPYAKISL